jgi:hypothetical protein
MSYVTVEVEVDLSQFSDGELRDELAERGSESCESLADDLSIREIYDLLHMGKDEQAMAAMKVFVCNKLGRIL